MSEKNKKLREALKAKVVELAAQKKENVILLNKMETLQMGINADRKKMGESQGSPKIRRSRPDKKVPDDYESNRKY